MRYAKYCGQNARGTVTATANVKFRPLLGLLKSEKEVFGNILAVYVRNGLIVGGWAKTVRIYVCWEGWVEKCFWAFLGPFGVPTDGANAHFDSKRS